jgi:hypothetical protein
LTSFNLFNQSADNFSTSGPILQSIMIVMTSATIFHLIRGEVSSAITTVVLLAMATFVAYVRWRVAPIRPRHIA